MWVRACGEGVQAEAFVFDKDGTILSFSHWVAVMKARAQKLAWRYGLPERLRDELLEAMGVDPATGQAHLNGAIHLPRRDVEERVARLLAGALDRPLPDLRERVRALFAEVDAEFPWEAHLELLPGARELLVAIKRAGGKVAVVTHDSTEPAARHLRRVGLDELVDVVVGLDAVGVPKPSPRGIRRACALLAVVPDRAVAVGDSAEDVLAGKRAGCSLTVGVLTGRGTAADLSAADCVVRSLEEIEVTAGR
ncbi:MAG: HAD family hydrolase [Caldiserica bacterium]|nr:HAD family hydrolase [Caldisericota bacterium]